MTAVRAAIYARFSSDLQRATSIDDQVAAARTFADSQGWQILEDHIYADAALSGSSLERPGLRALREAAARHPRPFDVVLVDDSSRVSRDLADAVRLLQELRFVGLRVVYISQNIDSANEQAETLIAVHGVVDSLYLKEMAKKIRRGLAGQLDQGFATGGVTYGYRTVPVLDPSGKQINGSPALLGKRVEIVPEQADVVRRIFESYAGGFGIGRIVERLVREEIPGPRGQRWKEGAVKRVLANEKYRGWLIWGRKTFERRPGTRQYVQRSTPRAAWRLQERPELRIIADELWTRVQARRAAVRDAYPTQPGRTLVRGRHAALYSRNLFAGFLRCAECTRAILQVSGGNGSPRYGCLNSYKNGLGACRNRMTIRAKVADVALLAGLRRELQAPATLAYITDQLRTALNADLDTRPRVLAEVQAARQDTQRRLDHLLAAIEQGAPVAALTPRLVQHQAELVRLEASLAHLAEPVTNRIAIMPALVRQQLDDLAGLLSQTPERLKLEFQRIGLRVVLDVIRSMDRPFYRATVTLATPLPGLAGIRDLGRPVRQTEGGADPWSDDLRSDFVPNVEQIEDRSTVGRSLLR